MTTVTSTQAVLADARVTYARQQEQQSSITGAKVNANPTESDLLANDPTLEAALLAAEETSTTSAAVGGASGSSGTGANGPASGGIIAKAAQAVDTSPTKVAAEGIDIQA